MDHDLPHDKNGAVEALKQRKIALMQLFQTILDDDYTTVSQISGLINSTVDDIDKKLDSGVLWDE